MSDSLVGLLLGGRYRVTKLLGRGGMAEVYLARQENLERDVALKLMHPHLITEADFLHRFKREAQAMAALNHPHIVPVYDFDVYDDDKYYLVMAYISGGSLKDMLAGLHTQNRRLPLEKAVALAGQIADALDYAHGRQMVHRDVKPGNVMLNERGQAVLTDFGIVKLVGRQSMAFTATGALVGTPAYMSPEQALGQPGDSRSDLYSLGVMLFQMVTGELPFAADTPLAVVMKHVNEPAPEPVRFNPDVPGGVQDVILRALAKQPDDRYQTAGQLARALRQADLSSSLLTLADTPPPAAPHLPPPAEPGAAPAASTTAAAAPAATALAAGMAGPVSEAGVQTVAEAATATAGAPQPAASHSRRRSPLVWVLAVVSVLLAAALGFLAWQGTAGTALPATQMASGGPAGNGDAASPSSPEAAAGGGVETAAPAPAASATATPMAAATPSPTASATPTLAPSATPSPRPTATPSATADATAAFLASCTRDVTLAVAYTYRDTRFRSAPVGATFPANWTLRNSGTCPWPESLTWVYVDGYEFGYEGTGVPLPEQVSPGGEVTLTATFEAPDNVNTFDSTWQLVSGDGQAFGPPVDFAFSTYVPATPTPAASPTPVASPTPEASPTSEVVEELNYIHEVLSCEYINTEWRCTVRLTPYGGGGGPYTLLVLDQPGGQATEFRGPGPHTYFAGARRCAAYNQEVRVIDDGAALEMSRHMYIHPNDYFEGGCTLP